jgi:hypothetical protein
MRNLLNASIEKIFLAIITITFVHYLHYKVDRIIIFSYHQGLCEKYGKHGYESPLTNIRTCS